MATIIRHFDSLPAANDAVEALRAAGVAEEQIGFLTKEGVSGNFQAPDAMDLDDMSASEGALLGTLAGMITAVAAMATPFGPLVAAGPLFGTLIGALAGGATGGVVASLVDAGVEQDVARRLAATLEDERAVLLSVEVPDDEAAEIRMVLAQTESLHQDELRFFERYHADHAGADFATFHDAYHFGYRAAAAQQSPFADAEPALRQAYAGRLCARS